MFRCQSLRALSWAPVLIFAVAASCGVQHAWAASFASQVLSYSPGTTSNPSYNDPTSALGSPERFSGEGGPFPSVVSPFSPPFLTNELVSIGEGGHLTLRLQNFALPQAGGPEIGVFSNVGIADDNYPNGQAGTPPFIFGGGVAHVEVSEDGIAWVPLGLHTFNVPTNGYLDAGPFDGTPGSVFSDFGKPFTGTLSSFAGLPYSSLSDFDILDLLDGSGGGTWIDISGSGLSQVGFVRFSVADDGDPFTSLKFELDALSLADVAVGAAVPEPSSVALAVTGGIGLGVGGWLRRKRHNQQQRKGTTKGAVAAAALVVVLLFASSANSASAATLLLENFADDPVLGGRATLSGSASRFSFAPGSATAHYDSFAPTAKLSFPLGKTLTQADDFSFTVDFRLLSAGYVANQNVGAQIAFGLTNALTTGNDRAGGTTHDAFDVVTFDYYANVSPQFGGPSLGPSVVQSDNGGSFFSRIVFPFGPETSIDTIEGEPMLPFDSLLRAFVGYQAATRTLTLTVGEAGSPLEINLLGVSLLPGGFDGDVTTIQNILPPSVLFSVDQFSIAQWQETFGFGLIDADVVFEGIHVVDASVPEPSTWAIASLGGVLGIAVGLRRRQQWHG
ncbi:MAG: PEP-CTERM sorting domain-containing protein [Pirellulales bacterium]|nr:PEP-CTERM sorting domain-containing protein [Pirellulales bacterium]